MLPVTPSDVETLFLWGLGWILAGLLSCDQARAAHAKQALRSSARRKVRAALELNLFMKRL